MYWWQCGIHHRRLRNKRLVKETYIIFPRITALPLWPMTINVDSCLYLLHCISIPWYGGYTLWQQGAWETSFIFLAKADVWPLPMRVLKISILYFIISMFVKYYLIILYNSDKLVCLSVWAFSTTQQKEKFDPIIALNLAPSGQLQADETLITRDAQETSYNVSWASSMSSFFPFQLFHITKFFIIRYQTHQKVQVLGVTEIAVYCCLQKNLSKHK